MSMEKKETSPTGLRRSFPPPIFSGSGLLSPVSLFFVFLRRLLAKLLGGLFMQLFLGHEEASG